MVPYGPSVRKRKCWEVTLFTNGTAKLVTVKPGSNNPEELSRSLLLPMATPGSSPTRVRSGELSTESGRTLLDVPEKSPLAPTVLLMFSAV